MQREATMALLSWMAFSALLGTALYFKLGCRGRTVIKLLCRRAWRRLRLSQIRKEETGDKKTEWQKEDSEEGVAEEGVAEEAGPKSD